MPDGVIAAVLLKLAVLTLYPGRKILPANVVVDQLLTLGALTILRLAIDPLGSCTIAGETLRTKLIWRLK